jgi:uncharacterized protein (TIGR03083 family)
METATEAWIKALRRSQTQLRALVEPLSVEQLQQQSYASEWSIAQVLSHLGSQAEIFSLHLHAGLSGEEPLGQDDFAPIWDSWNARSPMAQAADCLRVDRELVDRFESLDPEQRARLHLTLFGMELDTVGLARMRLGEHAVHTWDVAVALDPTATLDPDAVQLLVDTLGPLAARTGKADGAERQIGVSTTAPERHFTLELGESVALVASQEDDTRPQLRLSAEALVRLIYGRLDPAHPPPIKAAGIDLGQLRPIFPGF